MSDKKPQPKKISLSNTKQEMLDAYTEILKQLQERQEAEARPEEQIEEKATQRAMEVADALSTEGIVQGVSALKAETGKLLGQLSDRLEEEIAKYRQIKTAVDAKGKELREIFEIQKAASSLAALIEAQHRQRQAFDAEIAEKREEFQRELESTRAAWEKEQSAHEAEIQEQEAAELKRHGREKEEYGYTFQREQQLARDRLNDEKAKLEKEIQFKREQMERELAEQARAISQQEGELKELRQKVSAFPEQLEAAIAKAVKEAVQRAQAEAKSREELSQKEFAGERNVFQTRIESLERTTKEQSEQIAKLSQHLEKAYGQVQQIAVKALEGSSHFTSQQWLAEQTRKPAQEK